MSSLKATMDTKSWEETNLELPEGFATKMKKLSQVRTAREFKGQALNGKGVAYYNMVSHPNESDAPHDQTASYAGFMHFSGEIDGKKGDIVFVIKGTYDPKAGAVGDLVSDPQSGTGELVGLKATGGYGGTGMTGMEVTLVIG